MHDAVKAMLKTYGHIDTLEGKKNALKEIMQQLILYGMQRSQFFDVASFYGGTALRILHGLDRFSEDMDFCLRVKNPQFSFEPYLLPVKKELKNFGFDVSFESKKTGPSVLVESAFAKQNTLMGLINIGETNAKTHKDQVTRIRIEIDKLNPEGATYVQKLVKLPIPFMVETLDEGSLFSGKVHAMLARSYVNRVKGRDFYDFLFYTARSTPINIVYLEAKLRDSGHYTSKMQLTRSKLIEMLKQKFSKIDFEKAKDDVRPFLKKDQILALDNWSPELFSALADETQIRP